MKCFLQITLFFFMVVFVSCKKEETNQLPRASAGPDQQLLLPVDSTELRGAGTDADGSIVSYKWKRISGPLQYTFQNALDAITEVKNLAVGVYEFELTVMDDDGSSARDSVVVFVMDGPFDPCAGCWDY